MKNKLICILCLMGISLQAQYIENYTKTVENHLFGDSRYLGMSGAMGALGGNASSSHDNPAGLGKMIRNHIGISLGLYNEINRNQYHNRNNTSANVKLFLPDLAASGIINNTGSDKWKSFNVGFSVRRLADHKDNLRYRHDNNEYTLGHYFADQARGTHPDELGDFFPFQSYLAYQTYLINPDTTNNYQSEISNENSRINRKNNGRLQEWQASFGANYNNKLFLGASLALRSGSFGFSDEYTGINNREFESLKDYRYNFDYASDLTGFNAKFGMMYKINGDFQLGAYYHTPTVYHVSESFSSNMVTNFDDQSYSLPSEFEGFGEFRLTSPSRIGFSMAYTNPKVALFCIEIYNNQASAGKLNNINYSDFTIDFSRDQLEINNNLQDSWVLKTGIEKAFKRFALRAGAFYMPSVFNESVPELNFNRLLFSAGFGLRKEEMYLDFALAQNYNQQLYQPHPGALVGTTVQKGVNLQATCGFRF